MIQRFTAPESWFKKMSVQLASFCRLNNIKIIFKGIEMSYFFLLPAYWLCGILLYGASPRQKFINPDQRVPPKWLTLLFTTGLLILTVSLMLIANTGIFIALLYVFILFMFFIPAPVFLLSHRPKWAWPSVGFFCCLAAVFHLLGATHVA